MVVLGEPGDVVFEGLFFPVLDQGSIINLPVFITIENRVEMLGGC